MADQWNLHGPFAELGPDRVLISVIVFRPAGFPQVAAAYRRLVRLPLRLSAADQIATEEGAPEVPQYRFFRRVGCQYDLDVRVDFGRAHPTRAMFDAAQRALGALALPAWGFRCG